MHVGYGSQVHVIDSDQHWMQKYSLYRWIKVNLSTILLFKFILRQLHVSCETWQYYNCTICYFIEIKTFFKKTNLQIANFYCYVKGISLDSLEISAAVQLIAIIFLRLLQLSKTLFYLFWRRRKFKNRIDKIKWVQFYYLENYIYKKKYLSTFSHSSFFFKYLNASIKIPELTLRFFFSFFFPFLFSNSCTIMHLLSSAMRSTFEVSIFKRILNNQWLNKQCERESLTKYRRRSHDRSCQPALQDEIIYPNVYVWNTES